METPTEQSRTFHIDRDTAFYLSSSDFAEVDQALAALPRELTEKELLDIGIQVRGSSGYNKVGDRDEAERRLLVNIGSYALFQEEIDFTTANNSKNLLKKMGLSGRVGALLLQHAMWKTRRRAGLFS